MRCETGVRVIVVLGLAGVLSIASGVTAAAEDAASTRPNILYVMTDQQPLSCVGAYGNPTIRTPEIDKLAREGCLFERFYISSFPCSPSRASMLTGRYAHNHGVVENDIRFDEKVPCLGDICQAAGYSTAFFGKWHLGGNMYRIKKGEDDSDPGDDWFMQREPDEKSFRFKRVPGGLGEDGPQHGFATWVGGWKQYRDYLREVGLGSLLERFPNLGNHNDAPSGKEGKHIYSQVPEEHHVDSFLAKKTERFVRDQAGKTQPWCAVLSLYGPHLPVAPPKPWDTMYSLDQVALPANHRDTLEGKPTGQKDNTHCYVYPDWNAGQFKDYIRRYWGYCSFIDQEIGRVFKALRDTNQWDNTIIVFTTDHGDMVGAHGMIYKLSSCGYEELYHIPTIVRIPGVTRPGSRTDALAGNIDLLPTLLHAARIPLPKGVDGSSLISVLKGETSEHRKMVFSSCYEKSLVCCDGRYKFVLNMAMRDVDELYDLQSDPGEMKNLATISEHRAIADRMRQAIFTWLRETGHPYAKVLADRVATRPYGDVPGGKPELGKAETPK